jgi:hypothetical protein
MKDVNFDILIGKKIKSVKGLSAGSGRVTFLTEDNKQFVMYHSQGCCETVDVEDVCGSIEDILGSEILSASEESSSKNPEGVTPPEYQDSFTWTFYKIATIKGSMTIRWYGSSNGCYSEHVDFAEVT